MHFWHHSIVTKYLLLLYMLYFSCARRITHISAAFWVSVDRCICMVITALAEFLFDNIYYVLCIKYAAYILHIYSIYVMHVVYNTCNIYTIYIIHHVCIICIIGAPLSVCTSINSVALVVRWIYMRALKALCVGNGCCAACMAACAFC